MADRDPKWSWGDSTLLISPSTGIDPVWSWGDSVILDVYETGGGTTYSLTAAGITTGTPSLGSPTIGQIHFLTSSGITS